jgi:transcriptional regulator with PAS, ATPase and Fis domain
MIDAANSNGRRHLEVPTIGGVRATRIVANVSERTVMNLASNPLTRNAPRGDCPHTFGRTRPFPSVETTAMSRHTRPDASRIETQPLLPDLLPDDPPNTSERSPSAAMQRVLALAARVAPVDSTVLISGESGVGKERLARWLHDASRRARRDFVAVNCGAFADTLLESELFGYARGAFTGAVDDRPGLFEAAHGGTLFLDEIGEVSAAMQVRLLRVLQEREVRRVGETRCRPVDVRLIAATNRDLPDEVRRQRFREDLYYRLRVVELYIPPLRQRPADLRALAHDLLIHAASRLGRSIAGYTPPALDRILAYTWPGNIRELEHAIECACVVACGSEIDLEDLPESVRGGDGTLTEAGRLAFADRARLYIQAVIARHGGDRRRAAVELGISISTLKRRLRAPTKRHASANRTEGQV